MKRLNETNIAEKSPVIIEEINGTILIQAKRNFTGIGGMCLAFDKADAVKLAMAILNSIGKDTHENLP